MKGLVIRRVVVVLVTVDDMVRCSLSPLWAWSLSRVFFDVMHDGTYRSSCRWTIRSLQRGSHDGRQKRVQVPAAIATTDPEISQVLRVSGVFS